MGLLQISIVLLCWPQLCGETHLQPVLMQSPRGDPVGEAVHLPLMHW
jgi:hypothetical protein